MTAERLSNRLAATFALAATSLAVACSSAETWQRTREQVVEPLGQLVHKRYPAALRTMDVESAASLWAPAARDAGRADARALFEGFKSIAHGECVIDVCPRPEDGVAVADAWLKLDGIDANDRRRSIEQTRRLTCRGADGKWAIESAEVVSSREIRGEPAFTEEAKARGLVFHQASAGVRDRFGGKQKFAAGSGVAVGDVDGDGLEDVLFVNGGSLQLFRNVGGGKFEDVTAKWGLDAKLDGEGRMAVFADWDGDGHQDLFVGMHDGPNLLFHNEGSRFVRVPESASGLTSKGATVGAVFADFDEDGRLDLFIANGGDLLKYSPDPISNALNGPGNQLFLNRGGGKFEDVTERAGVGHTGWSLACTTGDYDGDGHVDLFVANDFGWNVLYRGRGDGTFEDVTEKAGIDKRGANMSCSFGDTRGDGLPDLYVAGMGSNSKWIIDHEGFPTPAPWPLDHLIRQRVHDIMKEMMWGNRYYRNKGDGTFEEVSGKNGTFRCGWAWSGIFFDYDCDGSLDLYATNGFISGLVKDDC